MALNDFFTKKQQKVLQSYLNDDWKYLFLIGAVRSGKTYISNWMFLLELKRVAKLAKTNNVKRPIYILAGYSSNSINTNIIASIENEFGINIPVDRHGHYHLFDVEIVPAYTGSIRGIGSIRGATAYGALIDEGTLADQGVFQEIINRCSIEGARIVVTSNPDAPTNFIKTEYIDNHDPKARIKVFNFTIFDNNFLSKDYVDALVAATPSGMFYDRSILGQWVTSDGIVYQDFNADTMVIEDKDISDSLDYYCGVDWGFAEGHENVITVFGDDPDTDITYLLDIYSSTGKYIDYWVEIAQQIQEKYGYGINFWADSARPEYVSYFQQNGIQARNADKSVMDGVEYCSSRIKLDKFRVLKSCSKPFLDDVYQYVWDPVKGVPKKEHDNVMDSFRYAVFNQHKKVDNQVLRNIYF